MRCGMPCPRGDGQTLRRVRQTLTYECPNCSFKRTLHEPFNSERHDPRTGFDKQRRTA